jgi:arylsulfatase A-like enzyme
MGIDLCPTILSLTGTPCPDDLDGIDLTPLLTGAPTLPSPRSLFFLQHPEPTHYRSYPTTRTPGGTIRQGPWKLIEHYETADGRHEHRFELYNLDIDLGESNNLAEQEPERVEAMRKAMAQWRASVNPPPYDASLYTAGKASRK